MQIYINTNTTLNKYWDEFARGSRSLMSLLDAGGYLICPRISTKKCVSTNVIINCIYKINIYYRLVSMMTTVMQAMWVKKMISLNQQLIILIRRVLR